MEGGWAEQAQEGRGGRSAKPVSGGPRSGRVGESGKEWERVVEQPRSGRGRNRATLKASSFHTNEQHLHCLDLPEHGLNQRLNMNGTSKHLKGRFVGTRHWVCKVLLSVTTSL